MEEGKTTVRSVERALDLLLCFTMRPSWAMTELAQQVGLHKSTVHRMLATLEEKGFIERDPVTDHYQLGLMVWELSANLGTTNDQSMMWQKEMERLRDQLGETVSVYVRSGVERIRIQSVQSNEPVRRVAPVGARFPLYAGASSKVLIAYALPEEQQEIWQHPTWQLRDELNMETYQSELQEVLEQGYAVSFEERESGVAAISVPIFDREGNILAALAVSGPSSRLTIERMKEYAPIIHSAARRMGMMVKS